MKGTELSQQERDDPITCLNKEMAFMPTIMASRFPSTNNQLRTSSNLRNQVIIQDDWVTVQQVLDEEQLTFLADPGVADGQATQTTITHNAAFQIDDLDAFDSDCDDISSAKAVLMANLSSYDSDVLFENRNAKFAAFEQEIDSLKQTLSKYVKENESLLTTFIVFKKESKENENKYIDKEIDLEKKIKELNNIVYKVGQSAQTVHMLTKPQVFYDDTHKQDIGYQNPFYLRKLNGLSQHCMMAFWLPLLNPKSEQLVVPQTLVKIEVPKELPKENDNLFELLLSQDIVHICVNSFATRTDCHEMQQSFIDAYNETLELKAQLAKKEHMVEKIVFNELVLRSKLKEKDVSIANWNKHIENLKGKNVVEKDVPPKNAKVIAPGMCSRSIIGSKSLSSSKGRPSNRREGVMLHKSNQTIFNAPDRFVGLYTNCFSLANLRLLLRKSFCDVIEYHHVHLSRLNTFSCANLTTFVVMCKAYDSEPMVELFRDSNIPSDCPELLSKDNRWDKKSFKDKLPPFIHENPLYQCLGRHLVNVRTFLNHILFLVGLKPSWEHGQQQLIIFVCRKEIAFRNSMYAEDDEDFSFLLREPPLALALQLVKNTTNPGGSPTRNGILIIGTSSVARRMKDRKSSLAKAESSLFLNIFDHEEVVDNAINQRAREPLKVVEQIKGEREFDKNLTVMVFRQKNVSLLADVEEHKESVERMLFTGKEPSRMIHDSVLNGPLIWSTIEVDGVTGPKTYEELSEKEKIQADCDLKATNIFLQGLLPDVYSLVNHHKVAKEI
ncbi:hypothetical protein Tco_0709084 [Tanacetum coccineum]